MPRTRRTTTWPDQRTAHRCANYSRWRGHRALHKALHCPVVPWKHPHVRTRQSGGTNAVLRTRLLAAQPCPTSARMYAMVPPTVPRTRTHANESGVLIPRKAAPCACDERQICQVAGHATNTYKWKHIIGRTKNACGNEILPFRNATCTATLNLGLGGTPMQVRPKAVPSRTNLGQSKQYNYGLDSSTT